MARSKDASRGVATRFGALRPSPKFGLSLRGPARLFGGMFAGWNGKSWQRGLAKLKAMMEAGEL
jgi:hypothetical protein